MKIRFQLLSKKEFDFNLGETFSVLVAVGLYRLENFKQSDEKKKYEKDLIITNSFNSFCSVVFV